MNELIKETENYELVVGYSTTTKIGDPTPKAYLIVNKKYNVVEVETFLLPQALKYIQDLEDGLNLVLSDKDEYSKIYNRNLQ